MLDHLLFIAWQETETGFEGRPLGPLPENFALLSPEHTDDNPIAADQFDEKGLRMRPAWVTTRTGPVVLAAPVSYDGQAGRFHATREAIAATAARVDAARQGPLSRHALRPAGCCGQMTETPISDRLAGEASLDLRTLSRDPSGQVWLVPGPTFANPGLPDALAFHGDDLPAAISLTIEATTACNFRCGFCYGRHMKQGVLRRDRFEALLDNTPQLTAVEFTGEGEPLLNRDTPAMIAACKARGIWVHVTTNGSRMTEARAQMLLDLNIDSFSISTEATDPETFRRMRPGGELADLISAVALMRAAIAQRGLGREQVPELRLWVSIRRSMLHRIEEFFAFADAHGFDRVEFQTLNTLPAFRRFYPDFLKHEVSDAVALDAALRVPGLSARAREALNGLRDAFSGVACHRFAHVLAPTYQGLLSPCCLLKVPDYPSLGDLTETPLAELWRSTRFRRFRFALDHGVILQSCHGCVSVAAACPSGVGEDVDLVEQPAHFGAIA